MCYMIGCIRVARLIRKIVISLVVSYSLMTCCYVYGCTTWQRREFEWKNSAAVPDWIKKNLYKKHLKKGLTDKNVNDATKSTRIAAWYQVT